MVGKTINLFGHKSGNSKKEGGLFKHDKDETDVTPISKELESTISRLRVLEERYTNVQMELRVTEENMIRRNKKTTTDIKTLTLDINELRNEIDEIKNKVLMVIKEIQGLAKNEDVKVLQKYIDMWEPMNFVTHKEVEEIINEKLATRKFHKS